MEKTVGFSQQVQFIHRATRITVQGRKPDNVENPMAQCVEKGCGQTSDTAESGFETIGAGIPQHRTSRRCRDAATFSSIQKRNSKNNKTDRLTTRGERSARRRRLGSAWKDVFISSLFGTTLNVFPNFSVSSFFVFMFSEHLRVPRSAGGGGGGGSSTPSHRRKFSRAQLRTHYMGTNTEHDFRVVLASCPNL